MLSYLYFSQGKKIEKADDFKVIGRESKDFLRMTKLTDTSL